MNEWAKGRSSPPCWAFVYAGHRRSQCCCHGQICPMGRECAPCGAHCDALLDDLLHVVAHMAKPKEPANISRNLVRLDAIGMLHHVTDSSVDLLRCHQVKLAGSSRQSTSITDCWTFHLRGPEEVSTTPDAIAPHRHQNCLVDGCLSPAPHALHPGRVRNAPRHICPLHWAFDLDGTGNQLRKLRAIHLVEISPSEIDPNLGDFVYRHILLLTV